MREVADAWRHRPLVWIGTALPLMQMLLLLFDRATHLGWLPEQLGIHTSDVFLFVGLNAAVLFMIFGGKQKTKWTVALFFVVFLFSDVRNYFQWIAYPQYAAREISADLQQRVGQGVLTGQWAPELSLENRINVVPVSHGFVNTEKPFEKYGITHILVWRYPLGGEKFEQWYPHEFIAFKPVASYKIKDSDLVLYEKAGVGE